MEQLNINELLNRDKEVEAITAILNQCKLTKQDSSLKKGIYIYGKPGSGKTKFILSILNKLHFDVVTYDAGDIRNKNIIETITKNNMGDRNIMSLLKKEHKPIAIIMDEIDGMNSGDKGGINSLIKIIRPKKTKKQRLEEMSNNPIICIGNCHIDKKFKELMKVCHSFELKPPTNAQILNILHLLLPPNVTQFNPELEKDILHFVQGDLRKVNIIYNLYLHDNSTISSDVFRNIFLKKSYNDDTRQITKRLFNESLPFNEHGTFINETDRTIVGLLWHENVIDVIGKMPKSTSIPFYLKALDNICFSDYIDRVTFQKQIWQFNEMSSLIKTFKNNKLYHDTFFYNNEKTNEKNNEKTNEKNNEKNKTKQRPKYNPSEVRFTKVLTKYSTEYNNANFIQNLCQELNMDKSDLLAFFLQLQQKTTQTTQTTQSDIATMFENYDITKLDINRIYRYIAKYIRPDIIDVDDIEVDDDDSD